MRRDAERPAWLSYHGVRRVTAEYKQLSKAIQVGKLPFVKEITLDGDDITIWHLKLCNFDTDVPGGRQLNKDLTKCKQDHILMEVTFPANYPTEPMFVRIVTPRCRMYTGHVTAGGSICLEALTTSGSPGSWQPSYSAEGMLHLVILNMIDTPSVMVQTHTGPGGRAGPLRIDFSRDPLRPYSKEEARSAFHRTVQNHRAVGWGDAAAAPPPAAAAVHPNAPGTSLAAGSAAGWHAAAAARLTKATAAARATAAGLQAGSAAAAAFNTSNSGAPAPGAPLAPPPYGFPPPAAISLPATYGFPPSSGSFPAAAGIFNPLGLSSSGPPPTYNHLVVFPPPSSLFSATTNPVSAAAPPSGSFPPPSGSSAPRTGAAAAAAAAGAAPAAAGSGAAAAPPSLRRPPPFDVILLSDSDNGDDAPPVPRQRRGPPRLRSTASAQPPPSAPPAPPQPPPASLLQKRRGQKQAQWEEDGVELMKEVAGLGEEPAGVGARGAGGQPGGSKRRKEARGAAESAAEEGAVGEEGGEGSRRRLHVTVDFPENWDCSEAQPALGGRLVPLPLPHQPLPDGGPAAPLSLEAAELEAAAERCRLPDWRARAQLLADAGLAHEDAVGALLLADGDLSDAQLRAGECFELGGAGKVYRDLFPSRRGPARWQQVVDEEAAARARREQVAREEVEAVLAAVEKGGVGMDQVVAVERVQNSHLWQRYCLKKQHVEAMRGPKGVNERQLFHGAPPKSIDAIVSEGFDFRLATGTMYGHGVYFAETSATSLGYSCKPDPVAGAAGMYGGPGAGAATLQSIAQTLRALQAQTAAAAGGVGGLYGAAGIPMMPGMLGGGMPGFGPPLAVPAPAPAPAPLPRGGATGAGVVKMVLAKVVLGQQEPGNGMMKRPDPSKDSVYGGLGILTGSTGCASGVYCHVIFDNHQAYPEYVVSLKRPGS